MALSVIGAGIGRTGTESLKAALEVLGFGPCDHMYELLRSTWRVEALEALERGDTSQVDTLFADYRSAVDFPFAKYYRELMTAYPDAKVVLTIRDADAWYESARKTILRGVPPFVVPVSRVLGLFSRNARGFESLAGYAQRALYDGFFEGRAHDRNAMTALFNRWNDTVQATVPAHRLLVFDVRQGWHPLCEFLGVAVPDRPFPRSNDGASFEDRSKLRNVVKLMLGRSDRA